LGLGFRFVSSTDEAAIAKVSDDAIVARATLFVGDRVVAIGGTAVANADQVNEAIRAHQSGALRLKCACRIREQSTLRIMPRQGACHVQEQPY
jgi:predicted metalloprotease with PDZ domain